jgi:hypothetical protein
MGGRAPIGVYAGVLLAAGLLIVISASVMGWGEDRPPGRILWRADGTRPIYDEWASYATGTTCWERDNAETKRGRSSPRAFLTSKVAPSASRSSYAFQLRDGDRCSGERAELGQGNPIKPGFEHRVFQRGDEVWIGYQFRIAADTARVSTWQCIGQFKAEGEGGPVMCPGLEDDRLSLEHARSAQQHSVGSDTLWQSDEPVVKDRWIKFLFHIRFDPNPRVGFVEFWADLADGRGMGVRVRHKGVSTMKVGRGDSRPADVHSRIGIYRDDHAKGSARAYFAGYTVGTTRAIVERTAFAPSPPRVGYGQ